MNGSTIASVVGGCMVAATCLSANAGDITATLDSRDGTTAFIVLDANSNELFRIASDGSVAVKNAAAPSPLSVAGDALVEGALSIASTNVEVHVGNVGRKGSAAGWDPNPKQSSGLWLETRLGGEGSGLYLDDDMIALWSPGDNDILRLYDEDRLPTGLPHLVVDAAGYIGVGVTNTASSRLRVAGRIESTTGGFKFPDGSVQTSAYLGGGGGGSGWLLGGNAGTTTGTDFIGTTDNAAIELKVNNRRALRVEPHASGPNLIGGASANSAAAGSAGGFIGGGLDNEVAGSYATVGGGYDNTATNNWATVAGGSANVAGGPRSAVGGGQANKAYGGFSAIGGGFQNEARGANAYVAGGTRNAANGSSSLAAGSRAKALHDGAFVWGDTQAEDLSSSDTNQFLVRANGGVGINTDAPGNAALHVRGERIRLYHPTGLNGSLGRINFGDADYVYLYEHDDDDLTIHAADGMRLTGGNVGVGTDPDPGTVKLKVAGTIESTSNGFRFPDGSLQSTAAGTGVPSGVICMWSGTLANIPSGWALCNGTGGTPNLTDRFLMGTSAGQNPGGAGGSTTHSHTIPSVARVSGQAEDITPGDGVPLLVTVSAPTPGQPTLSAIGTWNHGHPVTVPERLTANGSSLPPYYKLAFIMKQ